MHHAGENDLTDDVFSQNRGARRGERERGSRRGITQWAYVYVPPRERPSLVGPMAGAAAGVAVLELLVVLALRRRRQAAPGPMAVATNGGA